MTGSRGSRLRSLLLEGLMVLLGVLAALLVDEWRQDREMEKEGAIATARVIIELQQNLEELRSMEIAVSDRIERLRALEPEFDGTRSFSPMADRFGGYKVSSLSDAAWKRLTEGAFPGRVPADFFEEASELYGLHRQFQNLEEQIFRLVFGQMNFDPALGHAAWSVSAQIMEQQLQWTKGIIPEYEAFLDRWGAPHANPSPSTP